MKRLIAGLLMVALLITPAYAGMLSTTMASAGTDQTFNVAGAEKVIVIPETQDIVVTLGYGHRASDTNDNIDVYAGEQLVLLREHGDLQNVATVKVDRTAATVVRVLRSF